MPIRHPSPSMASLLLLAALTTTTACPGNEPGTDGTTTDAATTSTGPEPTTAPPLTTGLDDTTTTTGEDITTTVVLDSSGSSDSSSGSSGSSSGSSSDSGSTGTTGDTETTTGGEEACEIMLPPPGMCGGPGEDPVGPQFECNPITQDDCAAGEKCNPWASDGGGSWNATACFPADPAAVAVGGVCTVQGSGTSGVDDCELGAMCWGVDAATNQGTCIELCGCSYDEPLCDTPNTVCAIVNSGVLPLCIPVCNPLDPVVCPANQGCYPVGDFFQCAPDASGDVGAPGDACEYINGCDSGTVCLDASLTPGCPSDVGCCAASCDTNDPAAPCPAGTECVPWYEEGAEPDACLGSVGVCVAL